MIVTKNVVLNGIELKKTYSDEGVMISCGLEKYNVAYDALDSAREYEETETKVPGFYVASDVALAEITEVVGL